MTLIERVLRRGDRVSMVGGELTIILINGQSLDKPSLLEHGATLVAEIGKKLGVEPLVYLSFDTGNYGARGYPGINLQFETLSGDSRYAVFNVGLKRTRNSGKAKAGSPYPGKQFSVGRRSHFYKFWTRAGLKHPKSLTVYHDYMGHLKGRFFISDTVHGERLDKESLRPLSISHEELITLFLPEITRTQSRQVPDNFRINTPDMHCRQSQLEQGHQPNSATGRYENGISKQGGAVQGEENPSLYPGYVENQSIDEWLADYADDTAMFRT